MRETAAVNQVRRWTLVVAVLVLAAGCASSGDLDALTVRVATLEAELAAQERQAERLADLEDRLPPPTTTSTSAPDSDAACREAKGQWRDIQPRVMLWFQDNEPEIFAAWIAEPAGTPGDDRLWEALRATVPDDLSLEIARTQLNGEVHCGFDAFNDYIDHGYNTGEFPD